MYWVWQILCDRLLRDWKVVSKEEARRNAYFGLKGWLLVFYVMSALMFLGILGELLFPPDPVVLEKAHGGHLWAMRSSEIIFLAAIVPILVLAPRKHPLTPRVSIICIWAGMLASLLLDVAAFPERHDRVVLALAVYVVGSSLMTLYILNSKRVNVTFLNRVPA